MEEEVLKKKLKTLNKQLEKKLAELKLAEQLYSGTATSHSNIISDYENEIKAIKTEISQITQDLKNNTIKLQPEEIKETEMYKPYNITRRMHVIYALKGINDLIINDDKLKLTVMK